MFVPPSLAGHATAALAIGTRGKSHWNLVIV